MDKTSQQALVVDFEYDDSIRQQNLFTHLNNLLRDLGGKPLIVEVVVYGSAIEMLTTKGTKHSSDIEKLQKAGVIFRGCHNAMMKHGLIESELLDDITVVPSGIGHIVKTQLKGAVYIKA